MGGSGSRSFFRGRNPGEVKQDLRKEEEKRTLDQAYEMEVAKRLDDLLATANQRDVKAVRKGLDEIKKALESDIEGVLDSIFGGSVRKRTYVEGISDVDTLVILRDPELKSRSPQQVLDYFEKKALEKLAGWEISRGRLSLTFLREGLELQVLPAVRESGRTQIPSARGDQWSEIAPEAFFRKLTETNEKFGGKVVPVIKLAKILNWQQPESLRLSSYHIESLAIESFKGYSGLINPKAMLEHFLERSCFLVLEPIKDKTGQSVHVDVYLGAANSSDRKEVSAALDRVYRRMKNANVAGLEDQWLEPFGEDK
jgi:hypothetical protein